MENRRDGQGPGGTVRRQNGSWVVAVTTLAGLVASLPLTAAGGAVAGTLGVLGGAVAAAIGIASIRIGENLTRWASSDSGKLFVVPRERIEQERRDEGFKEGALHVAICGPAGSGKSSIVNALRGLRNKAQEAASTGTVETTRSRTNYTAHDSLGALVIHDVPGAGTFRVPAEEYYYKQKLYLYDSILIVQGDRFGEIEINLVRACSNQGQSFIVVRSRSDELIGRILRDEDCDAPLARQKHIESTVASIRDELERCDASAGVLEDLAELVVLVNNVDLRRLTVQDAREWPDPKDTEIQERTMLKALGKAGVPE